MINEEKDFEIIVDANKLYIQFLKEPIEIETITYIQPIIMISIDPFDEDKRYLPYIIFYFKDQPALQVMVGFGQEIANEASEVVEMVYEKIKEIIDGED